MAETGREAFERVFNDKFGQFPYAEHMKSDARNGWMLCLDAAIAKLRPLTDQAKLAELLPSLEQPMLVAELIKTFVAALEEMKQ